MLAEGCPVEGPRSGYDVEPRGKLWKSWSDLASVLLIVRCERK